MIEHEDLERLGEVMNAADFALASDLAELEGVDTVALHDFLSQPDPDTDGKDHG